ncbi:melanoma cell adhesion molecule b isoform X4 [Notolabrus celidotus]|uniref:melanoma cell adhesion molecule b isoform X4 n=1 Tax=Notolabrus celidotus TaxID=1203425 RepID=UPI00148FFF85|nr:melanoma cell adhesion molecule b isoform X4 [Notolabrus celidotus]
MASRGTSYLLFGLFVIFCTWGVWADMEVSMEDRVEVFRGDTAQINCMFPSTEGNGSTMIQWFYVTRTGEKQRIYFQDSTGKVVDKATPFTERISVNGTGADKQVVLTIRDVQLADELEFICVIGLTNGPAEGRTKLKVFKTPDPPTIEVVQTGISVNEDGPSRVGSCEVRNGFPKPNITWYRNNTPLRGIPGVVEVVPSSTSESSRLISVKSELNLKVMKEDKDDMFYCEVTYFVPAGTRMTETDKVQITVYYPPTDVQVWVESPKGAIKEGDTIELHCRDNGNPPSSVISFKHVDSDVSVEANVFLLENVTRLNSGVYECTSYDTETFDPTSGETSVFVNFLDSAVVLPKDSVLVAQGGALEATCNAMSTLKTETAWFKNGKEISKGHILTVKDASFEEAGTYTCVVTVPEIEGMETSENLLINVQSPPKILSPDNTDIEESYDAAVELSCHVRGFPTPNVTWTTSDGKVLETASETLTEDGIKSMVIIMVTSDIIAFCNASNDQGIDALAFNIKAKNSGVIIAVIIICILLLAILGSVLYFLYKKGKLCGRSGKQDLTKEKSSRDNIVVEMKSDNTEEAVLLGVNGEKQPSSNQ